MAKHKMAVYFQPETIKKLEQEYREDNCASKTEFIEKAVKFYIGYLRQQEEVNYLSPMITETVKAQINRISDRYLLTTLSRTDMKSLARVLTIMFRE